MPRTLTAAQVVTGLGETYEHGAVRVVDGEIAAVGPRESVLDGEAAPDDEDGDDHVAFPDATLVPGLIDCHVMPTVDGRGGPETYYETGAAERALLGARNLRATLEAGVTTVRVLGDRDAVDIALRDAIRAGQVAGPRVVATGGALTATGGTGDLNPAEGVTVDRGGVGPVQDGADAFRQAAREQVKRGADVVRALVTGGVLTPHSDPEVAHLTRAEVDAAFEVARTHGKRTSAHCHGVDGIRLALDCGVDTIEHATFAHRDPGVLERMADEGVVYVPELASAHGMADAAGWSVDTDALLADTLATVAAAQEAGVPIVAGSDAGSPNNPHGANARELGYLVEAGLAPDEAIRAATSRAAEALDRSDVGALEAGRRADLLAVPGDPLADITVVEEPTAVMKGGEFVGRAG